MGIRTRNLFLLIVCCFMLCHSRCSSSTQTFLKQGQALNYPDQLHSESRNFLLRFFDSNQYGQTQKVLLGLFYNTKMFSSYEPQWVADRNAKDLDGAANLTLGLDGSLKILYKGGRSFVLYSSPSPTNSSLVLQDDGNLVLGEFNSDGSSRRELWQSFDHPTDTLLPGMRLGFSNKTGKNFSLVSQRQEGYDYSSGSYTLGVDPAKLTQMEIQWLGDVYWTSGSWENDNFTSATTLSMSEKLNFDFVSNENGTQFVFFAFGDLFNPRLTLHDNGRLELHTNDPMDPTEVLVDCNLNYYRDGGCAKKGSECSERESYVYKIRRGIMSRSGEKTSKSLTLDDCGRICYNNCSCAAFAIVDGGECVLWSREGTFREATAFDGGSLIYTFTFRNDLQDMISGSLWWMWLVTVFGGITFLTMIFWCSKRCKIIAVISRQKKLLQEIGIDARPHSTKRKKEDDKHQRELRVFDLKIIVSATDNFSGKNQLGRGGYRPVYKGRLPDGQEIAVKRLSISSGQGLVEFKNEATLVSELQHTNLVRLLGFCVQEEEKALVYEYMPNKSLDFFLFDSTRKKTLNWRKRFTIIEGIAQGLVYLHKYSRLKVIHRDVKASNILLDLEMNPKISDFGMAKLLSAVDSEQSTKRIVGTIGYMPPEYALMGAVSMKIDVFSFGILLLEIVSGRKNNNRYSPDQPLNLTGHAWTLWKEGRGVELIDPSLEESIPRDEVLKCIQVGLLCVQDQASSRPTMIDVVFMLSNESAQLSLPKKPAFFISRDAEMPEKAQSQVEIFSVNELTISNMEVR